MIKADLGRRSVIIGLVGPLGAGKTTLTKLLAKELGIKQIIVSPTFVLNSEYTIQDLGFKVRLQHIDCWRMEDFDELRNTGLGRMLQNKDLIVIEWAEKFRPEILDLGSLAKIIWVEMEYGEKENERKIQITGY